MINQMMIIKMIEAIKKLTKKIRKIDERISQVEKKVDVNAKFVIGGLYWHIFFIIGTRSQIVEVLTSRSQSTSMMGSEIIVLSEFVDEHYVTLLSARFDKFKRSKQWSL